MRPDSRTQHDDNPMHLAVAGYEHEWPVDFEAFVARELIGRDGALVVRLAEIDEAPALLGQSEVTALMVNADRLGLKEMLLLQECRRVAPRTAVVVVAMTSARGIKDALEGGATAFVSWPASAAVVRQALRSGQEVQTAEKRGAPLAPPFPASRGSSDPCGSARYLAARSAPSPIAPTIGPVRPKRGGVHGRR